MAGVVGRTGSPDRQRASACQQREQREDERAHGLAHEGAVLDRAVGTQQHESRRVRACREDERLVTLQQDDDLGALEVLALVRASLDRRLGLAAGTELESQQVGRRSRARMVLDSGDAADEELGKLGLFAHTRGIPVSC